MAPGGASLSCFFLEDDKLVPFVKKAVAAACLQTVTSPLFICDQFFLFMSDIAVGYFTVIGLCDKVHVILKKELFRKRNISLTTVHD